MDDAAELLSLGGPALLIAVRYLACCFYLPNQKYVPDVVSLRRQMYALFDWIYSAAGVFTASGQDPSFCIVSWRLFQSVR